MTKEFFEVQSLEKVHAYTNRFAPVGVKTAGIAQAGGRILAKDVIATEDLPNFGRATMDGYAVPAASTYGASEANPAYLTVAGTVAMGEIASFAVGPGQCARIATGGMLPPGTDGVMMVEHTDAIDATTIEVYRSIAPGQHMVAVGEDIARNARVLCRGILLRPQEIGLLAALGIQRVPVFRRPRVGILSTGDEIVPIDQRPQTGQVRDVNSYTLAGLVRQNGGTPVTYDLVPDDAEALANCCGRALADCDMVFISGGSSVGKRDFTVHVLAQLPASELLVHGIGISPGKPTLLARVGNKPVWGLPGHVVSAMVVFLIVVKPFLRTLAGCAPQEAGGRRIPARLTRNIESALGRTDFVRVRLSGPPDQLEAEPVLGKSGLIYTMVEADGLVAVDPHCEGLDRGARVWVITV